MLSISVQTITEKVKDVIFETGLMSPRSAITTSQRFKEDYGLVGSGPIAAFTSRVNGKFKPNGITISVPAMAGCARVSNLISLLSKKGIKLTKSSLPGLAVAKRRIKKTKKRTTRRRS